MLHDFAFENSNVGGGRGFVGKQFQLVFPPNLLFYPKPILSIFSFVFLPSFIYYVGPIIDFQSYLVTPSIGQCLHFSS